MLYAHTVASWQLAEERNF